MSVKKAPRISLPKAWTKHVRSAVLHVISLAQHHQSRWPSTAAQKSLDQHTNTRTRIDIELDWSSPGIVGVLRDSACHFFGSLFSLPPSGREDAFDHVSVDVG